MSRAHWCGCVNGATRTCLPTDPDASSESDLENPEAQSTLRPDMTRAVVLLFFASALWAAACSNSPRTREPPISGAGGSAGETSSGTAGVGGTPGLIVVDASLGADDACPAHCSSDLHSLL